MAVTAGFVMADCNQSPLLPEEKMTPSRFFLIPAAWIFVLPCLGVTPQAAATYILTDLGAMVPYGINDAGQIVGYGIADGQRAVLWQQNKLSYLDSLGGSSGLATGNNHTGQTVGFSTLHGNGAYRAVLWKGASPTDLGTLGGSWSIAYGINNAGQVAGYSATAGNAGYDATLWNSTASLSEFAT